MSELIHPLPPIAAADYTATHDQFEDFDGACIWATLHETVRRGLCDLFGEDYYDATETDADEFGEEAGRAIEALVRAGFLRREWFAYPDNDVVVLPG